MNTRVTHSQLKTPDLLTEEEINHWESIRQISYHLSSPFFSYYFSLAALQSGYHVQICLLYEDQKPVAFIPFQFDSRIYRIMGIAERVGNHLNDYFGIIAAKEFYLSPDKLREYCQLNYLSFSHLRENQIYHGLTGETPIPSPVVDFSIDDTQMNSKQRQKKKHFEKESERRLKRAEQELGKIIFEFSSNNISSELKKCIDHKRAQYNRTNSPDPLRDHRAQNLLHNLANYNYESCSGILSTLYAGDTWLASHFGLINQHEMHYWFPVYNPDYLEYSCGRILIAKMIESVRERNLRIFDFGAGDSQMKRKFSNSNITVLKGVWRNNSIPALAYQSMLSTKWKYHSLVKRTQS